MTNTLCPICKRKFYSVLPREKIACPHCGYKFVVVEQEGRGDKRLPLDKDCDLMGLEQRFAARTADISQTGVGVKMRVPMPFDKNDTLRVVIKGFDIDSEARVMWVKGFDGTMSKAGLVFC